MRRKFGLVLMIVMVILVALAIYSFSGDATLTIPAIIRYAGLILIFFFYGLHLYITGGKAAKNEDTKQH